MASLKIAGALFCNAGRHARGRGPAGRFTYVSRCFRALVVPATRGKVVLFACTAKALASQQGVHTHIYICVCVCVCVRVCVCIPCSCTLIDPSGGCYISYSLGLVSYPNRSCAEIIRSRQFREALHMNWLLSAGSLSIWRHNLRGVAFNTAASSLQSSVQCASPQIAGSPDLSILLSRRHSLSALGNALQVLQTTGLQRPVAGPSCPVTSSPRSCPTSLTIYVRSSSCWSLVS